jgi:uncharacterized protein (DUF58 family)
MQFKEFRHYEEGDDIRHMSWPVTARTGRATIKIYEEDRERDVVLLVDTSGSALSPASAAHGLRCFPIWWLSWGYPRFKAGINLVCCISAISRWISPPSP